MVLDETKTRHSFTEFIDEKSQDCSRLLWESELFWNKLVEELIRTLKEFELFNKRYVSIFFNTLFDAIKHKLNVVNTFINLELEQHAERTRTEIRDMYDKLRVLYGHPKNRKILNDLKQKFQVFFDRNTTVKIEECIVPLEVRK